MDILGYVKIATSLIGFFSVVATFTPNRADNAVVDVLMRLVNAIGMNFGKAKNEDF